MLNHRSQAKISIRVYPGTARNEVVGFNKGVLQVRISAPPVRGKANKELVVFLSQLLNLRKNNITIIKGNTSRNKIVVIHDLSLETALKLLLIEPGFEL
ncbi:MAG: DUF167 domain-containing protein [Anaerolineales bacterium]|jgi:hypothetical protein|nr:DUF167 domain-containing protein [Anaerolineales bacterium]|tara:strand:- start:1328 stop:1624 length:297 start_codon:yes stop_codon:yes gene_type:complete